MRLLAVQEFAPAGEHGYDWYPLNWGVVFLRNIKIFVALADVDVNNVIVLMNQRLDVGLMKPVIQGKAVEAPVRSENEKHALVVFCRSLQRLSNLLVSVSSRWVELAKFGRNSILSGWPLLCQQQRRS